MNLRDIIGNSLTESGLSKAERTILNNALPSATNPTRRLIAAELAADIGSKKADCAVSIIMEEIDNFTGDWPYQDTAMFLILLAKAVSQRHLNLSLFRQFLLDCSRSPDVAVRCNAIFCIGIHRQSSDPQIRAALELIANTDSSPDVQRSARIALLAAN